MSRVWPGISMVGLSMVNIAAMGWGASFSFPHYMEKSLLVPSLPGTHATPWPETSVTTTNYEVHLQIAEGDHSVTYQSLQRARKLIDAVGFKVVSENVGTLPLRPAEVYLYGSSGGYLQAVAHVFPKSEITIASGQTAGFTYSSSVVIPMYLYTNKAYLANTLTHELTHVVLNQEHLGALLPTWLNEGFAWYNGMEAERRVNPASEQRLYQLLLSGIQSAKEQQQLLPLNVGEEQVLHHNAQYNLEFFDYLAVNRLISTYGIKKFQGFLANIHGEGVSGSFQRSFGISLQQYDNQFYQQFERVRHL